MKFNFQFKNRISVPMLINLTLVVVILLELYFVYLVLYRNLNPQAAEVVPGKIVKVDLKAYNDTTDLIQLRQDYTSKEFIISNTNPFKYSR